MGHVICNEENRRKRQNEKEPNNNLYNFDNIIFDIKKENINLNTISSTIPNDNP